jgi:hypothetical protein
MQAIDFVRVISDEGVKKMISTGLGGGGIPFGWTKFASSSLFSRLPVLYFAVRFPGFSSLFEYARREDNYLHGTTGKDL